MSLVDEMEAAEPDGDLVVVKDVGVFTVASRERVVAVLRDQEERIKYFERELARCREEPVRLLNPQMDRP